MDLTTPVLSIVIPLYNKEHTIARAINSILNQSLGRFELIVVNDGSTDSSVDVVAHFRDSRIRILNQENLGVSAARNRGVQEARSEYVSFLDADDQWHPSFLAERLDDIHKCPKAALFGCRFEIQYPSSTTLSSLPQKWHGKGVMDSFLISYPALAVVNSSVATINKTKFLEIGGFSEWAKWGEDIALWLRLGKSGDFFFNDSILATVFRTEEKLRDQLGLRFSLIPEHIEMLRDEIVHFPARKRNRLTTNLARNAIMQSVAAVQGGRRRTALSMCFLLAPQRPHFALIIGVIGLLPIWFVSFLVFAKRSFLKFWDRIREGLC